MNNKKIINIIIIIVALALIVFLVVKGKKSETPNETPNTETPSTTENGTSTTAGNQNVIPVPAESSWTSREVENELTFDAPAEYYISYPVIGGCEDVVSVSTQTESDPTIAVAIIYKEGCVDDADVTQFYAHREVKDGYVFQTNSTHPSVLAVFNRIVASAEIK